MRYNVPDYDLAPPHGSHGIGLLPLRFLEDGVSATSTEEHGGGHRDVNVQHGRTLNPNEVGNQIRLIVFIFGYGSIEVVNLLLGQELSRKCTN